MPNIASLLKTEISRLARKEVRTETEALKKATTRYRSEIAELKRQIASMQRQLKNVATGRARAAAKDAAAAEAQEARRFSAKGLASHRRRLGLSAEAFGALVGVTGQSIYKWEAGKARPRSSQMDSIATLRKIGKREANKRLEALQQQ